MFAPQKSETYTWTLNRKTNMSIKEKDPQKKEGTLSPDKRGEREGYKDPWTASEDKKSYNPYQWRA